MGSWYYETFEGKTRYGVMVRDVLYSAKSDYQKIEILDTIHYGPVLVIDGIFMTGEKEEHFYHEMLVQPAMTTAARMARVLIIGGGDGGTAREILRHPGVQSVVMVEIDPMVVEACRAHMPTLATAWSDPRLDLIIGDGIAYVKRKDLEPFDIIFLDGCDPVGPSEGLFNAEFYGDCKRLLTEGGVFALQTGSPILQQELFVDTVRALKEVFQRVAPYFGPAPLYASDQWSWTLASDSHDHLAVVDQRARLVEKTAKYYNRDIHRAAFAVPNNLREILKPHPGLPLTGEGEDDGGRL